MTLEHVKEILDFAEIGTDGNDHIIGILTDDDIGSALTILKDLVRDEMDRAPVEKKAES